MDAYEITTLAERPELRNEISHLERSWPEFMVHSRVVMGLWSKLYDRHPECQFVLTDRKSGAVRALGNSLPVCWSAPLDRLPARGVEWALESRFDDDAPAEPNRLCALQIVMGDALRGKRMSGEMVRAMRRIGRSIGLDGLIAPVRPNDKHRYPLQSLDEYVTWTRDDGLPLDPWLRVHVRLGGEVLHVCSRSLVVEGTVGEWERWTKMSFPRNGRYVIPNALVPVDMDLERGRGTYVEPNIWVVHS